MTELPCWRAFAGSEPPCSHSSLKRMLETSRGIHRRKQPQAWLFPCTRSKKRAGKEPEDPQRTSSPCPFGTVLEAVTDPGTPQDRPDTGCQQSYERAHIQGDELPKRASILSTAEVGNRMEGWYRRVFCFFFPRNGLPDVCCSP